MLQSILVGVGVGLSILYTTKRLDIKYKSGCSRVFESAPKSITTYAFAMIYLNKCLFCEVIKKVKILEIKGCEVSFCFL